MISIIGGLVVSVLGLRVRVKFSGLYGGWW